jgi:membrane associated rhomboid family serine protease
MSGYRALTSDLGYLAQLLQAGMAGLNSARRDTEFPRLGGPVWVATGVGAVVGTCSACLRRSQRIGNRAALGGLVGSGLGLACGLAWASRGFTRTLVRGAAGEMNAVRDVHWLKQNPIDYA